MIAAAIIAGDFDMASEQMLWADDEFYGMGTVITNKVYGKHAENVICAAREETARLEGILSRFIPDSDIGRLNAEAGGGFVQVSRETSEVLSWAVRFSECSHGRFDITIAPLSALWSGAKEGHKPPGKKMIADALKLVNYTDVILDIGEAEGRHRGIDWHRGKAGYGSEAEPGRTVHGTAGLKGTAGLRRTGQSVDLGGIGKGFAADRILDTYKMFGITSAFTNFGGNVAVLGAKPDGSPWNIGIRHPRKENGLIGAISVSDRSVVTSGDYQRYFMGLDGKRYHHILDPKNGYPAESGLTSATVVCESSMAADALSTALFVSGFSKDIECVFETLECFPGAEAVLVDKDMTIYVTDGLWGSFQACDYVVVKRLVLA